MPLTAIDLGYLAGIVDGEGSIMLQISRARASRHHIYPILKIANTDKRLISWLMETIGKGAVNYKSRLHEQCKDVYHWGIASNQAYDVISLLRDHLKIKQRQADVVIALWDENKAALAIAGRDNWGNYHPIPIWLRHWREMSYLYVRDLNRRGPGGRRFGKRIRELLASHDEELAEWRTEYAA